MNISFGQVLQFHQIFGHPIRFYCEPTANIPEKALRFELLREEVQEFIDAYRDNNRVEVADALGDIAYVAYGAALCFGLDIDHPQFFDVDPDFERLLETERNTLIQSAKYDLDWADNHLGKAFQSDSIRDIEVALVTVIRSVQGAARFLDIPLDKVVTAIHRSNMSKLGEDGKPIYRPDGKVLKGPFYTPPTYDIKALLSV